MANRERREKVACFVISGDFRAFSSVVTGARCTSYKNAGKHTQATEPGRNGLEETEVEHCGVKGKLG